MVVHEKNKEERRRDQMQKNRRHLYEGMYVFDGTLSEDASQKALERITAGIEQKGGAVEKVHNMGRKKLAYTIRGVKQGYYFLVYFSLGPDTVKELWKEYHLNEDLLRYLTKQTTEVLETLEFSPLKPTE